MIGIIDKLVRLSRRMRLESGCGPSAAELAGYLHLPLAEVRDALARAKELAAAARADGGKAGDLEVPGGLIEALTAEEEDSHLGGFIEAKALAKLPPKDSEDS